MPIYDYKCADGHVTESIQPMDRSVIACPSCNSPADRQAANHVAWSWQGEIDSFGSYKKYVDYWRRTHPNQAA